MNTKHFFVNGNVEVIQLHKAPLSPGRPDRPTKLKSKLKHDSSVPKVNSLWYIRENAESRFAET